MYQIVDGLPVEVVEFDTMPELPITGLTEHEAKYERLLSLARGFKHESFDPKYPRTGPTAEALHHAIETGQITEPGKYGIHILPGAKTYEIHKIIEE